MTKDSFDPSGWSGDAEELEPHKHQLFDDEALCEATFMSKHEAFTAGLHLGSLAADETSEGEPGS